MLDSCQDIQRGAYSKFEKPSAGDAYTDLYRQHWWGITDCLEVKPRQLVTNTTKVLQWDRDLDRGYCLEPASVDWCPAQADPSQHSDRKWDLEWKYVDKWSSASALQCCVNWDQCRLSVDADPLVHRETQITKHGYGSWCVLWRPT